MAKEATGHDHIEALADRGYHSGEEIRACQENRVTSYAPKTPTSGNLAQGLFDKRDFRDIAKEDEYECPAGERAIFRLERVESGKLFRRYWSLACVRSLMRWRSEWKRVLT